MAKELLTHSRQDAFKSCRRKAYYSYEIGLRRIDDAKALRQGSAFHDGVEQLGNGRGLAAACDAVRKHYARCPVLFDPLEWDYERETVLRMVCAYDWRWSSDPLVYVSVERQFQLPLINPATGKRSQLFDLAGKIDGIVRLEDGRLAVKETKLLGDDISLESDLWRRLRMDHQISLYMNAARQLGYDVRTVLYDVARKPSIAPTQVPILDELGCKIVLNERGARVKTERGQWRQTADKAQGFVLQSRMMTADEWGEKLSADIAERPDFYFGRHEIARLDQDLDEFASELWDIQQLIRDAQKNDRWYRTVNRNTCPYCPYFSFCADGRDVSKIAPDGFEFVADKHPELNLDKGETNVNSNASAETATARTATSELAATGEFHTYW